MISQRPIISCARCGAPFEKTNGRKRFCTPCGPIAERERSVERARERRSADPAAWKEQRAAFASSDRATVRTYNRERGRRLGAKPLGELLTCEGCGYQTPRTHGMQRRCPDCSKRMRSERAVRKASEWNRANSDQRAERSRRRYATDPMVKLNSLMATGIGGSLRGNKGGRAWATLVPYGLSELKAHLERQFLPGMSWANWGRAPDGWHVDHILPVASFVFTTAEDPQFSACWAITNLRPLWSADNLRKGKQRLFLI